MKTKDSRDSSTYFNTMEELTCFQLEEIVQLFFFHARLGKMCCSSKGGWKVQVCGFRGRVSDGRGESRWNVGSWMGGRAGGKSVQGTWRE